MPNIFKAFSKAKAEPYQFPDAAELAVEPEPEEEPPAPEEGPPEEAARLLSRSTFEDLGWTCGWTPRSQLLSRSPSRRKAR